MIKHRFQCNLQASVSLKVEKVVIQFHTGLSVDALTHKEGQLVGILAGSGHSDDSLKDRKLNRLLEQFP